jgi:hypothetical protein
VKWVSVAIKQTSQGGRDVLTWFDAQGDRHLSAIEQESKARTKAEHRAAQLEDYL